MSIRFNKGGLLTTVQDRGRIGAAAAGINRNGAMDTAAARLINVLVGSEDTEAVLEMHFPAPEIVFEENARFALGGADFGAQLDGRPLENWRINAAEKGDTLRFNEKVFGQRAYLSIAGGFRIEKILGSASTNLTAEFGGLAGRKIAAGDQLFFNSASQKPTNEGQRPNTKDQTPNFRISARLIPLYSRFPTVRVTAGAEFEQLTAVSEQDFFKTDFVVSNQSNRMGYQLAGKPLYRLERREIVSSAVNFGTVQLLPDGQLIVLMADHQTTGGYPRIASIAAVDLPLAAQLGAGDKIAFYPISHDEAERLLLEFERDLKMLETGVRFHR